MKMHSQQTGYALVLCLVFSALLSFSCVHISRHMITASTSLQAKKASLRTAVLVHNLKRNIEKQVISYDAVMQRLCVGDTCTTQEGRIPVCNEEAVTTEGVEFDRQDWSNATYQNISDEREGSDIAVKWMPKVLCLSDTVLNTTALMKLHILTSSAQYGFNQYHVSYWNASI